MATIPRKLIGTLGFVALTLSLAAAGDEGKNARERGIQATVDNVPPAVRATVARESQGAKLRDVVPALRNGTTVYVARYMVEGTWHYLVLAADGNVITHRFEGDDGDDD